MHSLAIRDAAASDAERLLPLIEAYWQYDAIAGYEAARLRRQLEVFLSTPAYGCGWLAMSGSIAVGYLLCSWVYSFEHGGLMAEVDELFVVAERRAQRVGQALVARARTRLAARGCICLQMQVADDNVPARRFYGRLGFEEKRGYRLWVAPLSPAPPAVDKPG
ncbi:MAG: GNAT family N-acetyltransferase [Steroidobacterales bacterium]